MDPILERILAVAGTFLVLSLTVEKVAEMFKLSNAKLRTKEDTVDAEKKRERAISIRAAIIGCILALFLKADAIQIVVSGEPGEVLGWEHVFFSSEDKITELGDANYEYYKALQGLEGASKRVFFIIQMILGMICSGVAMSFGSKVWHDVIGIVYEVKRARQAIANKQYKIED